MKLTLHCNHRSGHLKTEQAFSYWSRGPATSIRRELLVAQDKLGQFPLLILFVVPV
jgi:hypothetical protein